ncbi:MAG TPA: cytochrome c biogenesis CcdA family protein [candidate division Zixibacteria bacterium]|nr:cytochrome c biogenesis CcdA family protein [candidate division Zixibacteria bacterium]
MGSISKPLRSLSPLQMIVLAIVALVLLFLIVGSITQSASQEPAFNPLANQPFALLAMLAFVGGMLSFASPCTLPILPAYFAFAFQSGRKQIALNTIVFMLGLATVFSLMGAGASFIGRILREYQTLIMLLAGSLVIVFGVMSLLGKGFSGVQPQQEEKLRNAGIGGSYFFGMTFAVGWTSCIGPILGIVLALAGTTASVSRGMMLLFIYALGLGLPLIIVSTFFGRASRQSMLWRALRGKGWNVSASSMLVGLIWALAIWLILVGLGHYAFDNFAYFDGQEFTAIHQYGLLVLAILGAGLWVYTAPGRQRIVPLHLHTTQLFSGILFILMGFLMVNGTLASFNTLIPTDLAIWFADLEDKLVTVLN